MFQDDDKLLVTYVGGVFIYHRYQSDLYKPYLKGSELEPDQNGVAAIHWPGYSNFDTVIGSMYISKDVASANRKIPSP
jgi:peptide/nickel transport system substrate-binding protein/oligopeptide transport system substrate-binding protein